MQQENIKEIVNTKELKKDWENSFYERAWKPDTLTYTEIEKKIINKLRTFLPRHMEVYDWNLPYADEIILILRRHISPALQEYGQWVRQQTLEEAVDYFRENLKAGESYERGDVYLRIGEQETIGSDSFYWDDDFWYMVLQALKDKNK